MFDLKTNWFAFLSTSLVNICVIEAKRHCLGCRHKKYSPLLHTHHQMSLYDKLGCHFTAAKTMLIDGMPQHITAFKKTISNANEYLDDNDVHCLFGEGVDFLLRSTPSTVYYGCYVEGFNDTYVEEACLRVLLAAHSPNANKRNPDLLDSSATSTDNNPTNTPS